jgi:RNA polymerase primary sigma factor
MTQTLLRKPSAKKSSSSRVRARTRTRKVDGRTFINPELESAFVHFMQLSAAEVQSEEQVLAATKKLMGEPIEFLTNEHFESPEAEALFLGESLLGRASEAGTKAKSVSLPAHLARLCEAKLLTPEEEKSLFLRMNYLRYRAEQLRTQLNMAEPNDWLVRRIEGLRKAADWHRDFIVRANMRLVISIVKKFVNTQNAFDDLLSDGIVALLRAVEKFDAGLGFRFSTYATQVVRRNTYRRVMEKQSERQRVTVNIHDEGLDLSDDQKESSMSESRWHELRSRLVGMLDQLDRREKFIIRARFSLGAHRRIQTLQRLADVLGVSKERVRQLEKRALDKLRGMASESSLPELDA